MLGSRREGKLGKSEEREGRREICEGELRHAQFAPAPCSRSPVPDAGRKNEDRMSVPPPRPTTSLPTSREDAGLDAPRHIHIALRTGVVACTSDSQSLCALRIAHPSTSGDIERQRSAMRRKANLRATYASPTLLHPPPLRTHTGSLYAPDECTRHHEARGHLTRMYSSRKTGQRRTLTRHHTRPRNLHPPPRVPTMFETYDPS
jgi:hypothetical protein